MDSKELQILFNKNKELTRKIYGRTRPFVAYLITRCDKEAIQSGEMKQNGLLNVVDFSHEMTNPHLNPHSTLAL
jgi:hypothetical protein